MLLVILLALPLDLMRVKRMALSRAIQKAFCSGPLRVNGLACSWAWMLASAVQGKRSEAILCEFRFSRQSGPSQVQAR